MRYDYGILVRMPNSPQPTRQIYSLINSLFMKRLLGVLLGLLIGLGLFVVSVQAAEPQACGFGLLQCDEGGVVWDIALVTGSSNVAQLTGNDGLAEAILMVGYFLNYAVVPLLMAIALLAFLYFTARYFILDQSNVSDRREAATRALWGVGAFVFIVSIWGIVNLLVVGPLDREASLCPDYLRGACRNLGYDRAGGSNLDFGNPTRYPSGADTSVGGNDTSVGGNDTSVGGNDTSVGGNPPTVDPASISALGELIFGKYRDEAYFTYLDGAPRAAGSAILLDSTASCVGSLRSLQTAASLESLHSGYALVREPDNTTRWINITDVTGPTEIGLDAEFIDGALNVAQKVTLVHTHPQIVVAQAGLNASGFAPSISDFDLLCDDVTQDASYVVVDQNTLWVIKNTGAACPRRAQEVDNLKVVATLLQLAVTEVGERNETYAALLDWEHLPPGIRNNLRSYANTDFDRLTSQSIVLMADNLARQGDTSITRMTPGDFCATF